MKLTDGGEPMADNVTLPQISINGTHPASLLDGYLKCRSALTAARRALVEHGPNGRDYEYTPAAFDAARREHEVRLTALDTIDAELVALMMHASDAVDARERR
jgi:hypothetical protein